MLPITAPLFLQKINDLAARGLVSDRSRVLFVNDGSKDKTWELIQGFAKQDEHFIGIAQSRNRGHQNAVLAGLMEALHSGSCDITISIDCDGQDDINAMDEMVQKYLDGAEVVYGVRSRRDTDTFFKRFTAEGFYHVMNALGADIVFNHADYRLISTRVLESFADYHEVNIFLRGMVPLVGFPHDVVTYERHERLAGESHYPLSKMLALAFDGITSLSNKPIRIITGAGIVVSLIGFIGVIWAIVQAILGSSVAGWASIVCIVCFMGGVQLVCLGVIGEYIGKIYMETKARPRYIIFFIFVQCNVSPDSAPKTGTVNRNYIFSLTVHFAYKHVQTLLFFCFFLVVGSKFARIFGQRTVYVHQHIPFHIFLIFSIRIFHILNVQCSEDLFLSVQLHILVLCRFQ